MITVDPYPVSSTLHVLYYIKLPQPSQEIMNGSGVAYNLNSYLGPADLWTLMPEVVRTTILIPVLQDGPVLLEASNFNLQNANTNASGIRLEIDRKILKLAWHQLCASIFIKLCPGYSNQPQAVLKHIKQSYIDADGNNVCIPVFPYYKGMMNTMCPFAGEAQFPKSVCNALIDGLNKRFMAIFHRNYVNHTVLHDLQASYQRSQFPIILQAMQSAKDEVHSISAIARSSIVGQAFKLDALAFPSQAKQTLAHYLGGYSSNDGASGGYKSDGGASSGYRSDTSYPLDRLGGSKGERDIGQRDSCFGCKGIHPWMKNNMVVCPNADKPGIRVAAQAAYKKGLEKSKALCKNRKRNRSEVDYNKLSNSNKAKVKEAVLASISIRVRNDGDTTPSKADSGGSRTKKPVILMVDIVVLLSATATCDILPAPIVSNFPHIHLQLGSNLD
jgi:hypothetical protein